MEKTFEELVDDIKTMHTQIRPVYDARPITGKRIAIEREGKEPVDAIIYQPKQPASSVLPVLFNMHGGGFTGGDAVLMDSYCHMLSERLPAKFLYILAPTLAPPLTNLIPIARRRKLRAFAISLHCIVRKGKAVTAGHHHF